MELPCPSLASRRQPKKPVQKPEERVKNACYAFREAIKMDDRSLQFGWRKTLGVFREVAQSYSHLLPYFPFDYSFHAADSFADDIYAAIGENSWNLSRHYVKSALARGLGYAGWRAMAFVLSTYQDFLKGEHVFDGCRLAKVRSCGKSLILPGVTFDCHGGVAGEFLRLFEYDGAWYACEVRNPCVFAGYSRYWGMTASDCVAWVAANKLLAIGPKAWNAYHGIEAGTRPGPLTYRRFSLAEEHTIRWIEGGREHALAKRLSELENR